LEWYKCTADAADVDFEAQGTFTWFGTTTETVDTLIRLTIELKNPIDNSLALARLEEKMRAKVISELKAQLSPPPLQIPASWQASTKDLTRLVKDPASLPGSPK
jgi:hypothetical protein